ncbi:MAG: hypothetical protein AABX61_01850 [Nanoarchaeota archaeon]
MRSQAEFNWIFIIVAGAIILTFFISFGLKYKSLQDEKLAIELLINFDNSLTNLQASSFNTFDVINVPKEIELTCNNFNIESKDYANTKMIFSPKKLNNKIYIYYKEFKFPFKVDSLYYILNQNNRYYLVYNSNDKKAEEFAQSLINDLPEKIKSNLIISNVKKTDGKNIFINSNLGNSSDVKIVLNQDKILISKNKIIYDDVNKELVYGIIFSEDFDCVYNKLKSSLDKVIQVNQKKLVLLQGENCNYNNLIQYLTKLKTMHFSDTISLETLNLDLESKNCPTLY